MRNEQDEIAKQSDNEALRRELETATHIIAAMHGAQPRGVRKRSSHTIFGLPLYDIAAGPDPEKGEVRGRACGILAIGDIATGFLAIGGMARGGIAIGGVAVGVVSLGGVALGGLVALGGFALGGVAIGGAAVGVVAVGGAALGYYACGGAAAGRYVIDGMRQNPEAVRFFQQWLPGLK